jgi:hypothetical protein
MWYILTLGLSSEAAVWTKLDALRCLKIILSASKSMLFYYFPNTFFDATCPTLFKFRIIIYFLLT